MISHEVAHEIARIFEYQIAMMKDNTNIQKLAKAAVDKIFKHFTKAKSFEINRNKLLEILLAEKEQGFVKKSISVVSSSSAAAIGEISLPKKVSSAITSVKEGVSSTITNVKASISDDFVYTIDGDPWEASEIFSKVGLRKQNSGSSNYEYFVKPMGLQDAEQYGYRSVSLLWDSQNNIFTESPLDQVYTQEVAINPQDQYLPFMRLVHAEDLMSFGATPLKQMQERSSTSTENFQKHFSTLHAVADRTEIIPVFRLITFKDTNLRQADFSYSDMIRISIQNTNLRYSKFSHANMSLSQISDTDFSFAILEGTDTGSSYLYGVKFNGKQTTMQNTKFTGTILDGKMSFIDNIYYPAVFQDAIRGIKFEEILEGAYADGGIDTITSPTSSSSSIMSPSSSSSKDKEVEQENSYLQEIKALYEGMKEIRDAYVFSIQEKEKFISMYNDLAKKKDDYEEEIRALKASTSSDKTTIADLHKKIFELSILQINCDNSPITVPDFIGRSTELENLQTTFSEKSYAIEVIQGEDNLGGMGKTQLALKYLEKYKKEYNSKVRWFTAENENNLISSFRKFAREYSAFFTKTVGRDIETANDIEIVNWVQKTLLPMFDEFLFVFDNVQDDNDYISKYLPIPKPRSKYHVIITTRSDRLIQELKIPMSNEEQEVNSSSSSSASIQNNLVAVSTEDSSLISRVILSTFTENEIVEYARIYVHTATRENAQHLQDLTKGLPLFLSQSLKYIRNRLDGNIVEYIAKYKEISNSALIFMILDALSNVPNAKEIMRICAYLDADNIPLYLFDYMFDKEPEKVRTIALLESYSLISVKLEEHEETLNVHRNIQESVRDIDVFQSFEQAVIAVSMQLADCSNMADEMEILRNNQPLLQHIQSLIDHYDLNKDTVNESAHIAVAKLYSGYADWYFSTGEINKALGYYKKAFEIRIKFCASDSSEIVMSHIEIGNIYKAKKIYSAEEFSALEEYNKAYKILERTGDLRQLARVMTEIGNVHLSQHNYKDALVALNEALLMQLSLVDKSESTEELARINKAIPKTLNLIGNVHRNMSKEKDKSKDKVIELNEIAMEYYDQALKRTIANNDISSIIITLNSIANIYRDLSDYDQAIIVYKIALDAAESDSDTNSMALTLNAMGKTYLLMSRQSNEPNDELNEALKHHHQALDVLQRIYGENNDNVAITYRQLGNVYRVFKDYKNALIGYQKSCDINAVIYGEVSEQFAMITKDLAELHAEFGQNDEALRYYELSLMANIALDNKPNIARIYNNKAEIYNKMEKTEDALKNYELACNTNVEFYGENHSIVVVLLSKMANINKNLGNKLEALRLYKKMLPIQQTLLKHGNHNVNTGHVKRTKTTIQSLTRETSEGSKKKYAYYVIESSFDNPILNEKDILLRAKQLENTNGLHNLIEICKDTEMANTIINLAEQYGIDCILKYLFVRETSIAMKNAIDNNHFLSNTKAQALLRDARLLLDDQQFNSLVELGNENSVAEQILLEAEEQEIEEVLATLFNTKVLDNIEVRQDTSNDILPRIENIESFIGIDVLYQFEGWYQYSYAALSHNSLTTTAKKVIQIMANLVDNLDNLLNFGALHEDVDVDNEVAITIVKLEHMFDFVASGTIYICSPPKPPHFDPDPNSGFGGGSSGEGDSDNNAQNNVTNIDFSALFIVGNNISINHFDH